MSLPPPYYDRDGITIYHGDCREIIPGLEPMDLVVVDPPYHGILDEKWDRQWRSDEEYLSWLDAVLGACFGGMQDNGTLYIFCSSTMAGRIEGLINTRGKVISSCVWDKGRERNGVAGSGINVGSLRRYWPDTERCLVAERTPERYIEADEKAKEACGFWAADKEAKGSIFGDYLASEFRRAGVKRKEIARLFPSRTGRLTGCVSNWLLGHNIPTRDQYERMRRCLNERGSHGEYLRKEYEYLRKEYEDLRKEYEDLRKEYEDLRRPFRVGPTDQWGELWRWPVPRRGRVHPAQKPLGMIRQIVSVSSRRSGVVLDPFMGSGTTLVAARDLGRRAIGIEIEEKYCALAAKRLAQGVLPLGGHP